MPRPRGFPLALSGVSAPYAVVSIAGTAVAERDGLSGEPLGWDMGGRPLLGFLLGPGTALSAPLALLVALAIANHYLVNHSRRSAARLVVGLATLFLAGALVEPITWEVLAVGADPVTSTIVIANLVLPAALIMFGIGYLGRWTDRTERANRAPFGARF